MSSASSGADAPSPRGEAKIRAPLPVDRVRSLSARTFHEVYRNRRPVIVTGGVDHWPARRLWSADHFRREYGHITSPVEVLDEPGRAGDSAYYVANVRGTRVSIAEYLDIIEAGPTQTGIYLTGRPLSLIAPELLAQTRPAPFFSRMMVTLADLEWKLWMGPKDCVSAMHYDGLESFVAQVFGRKKWTMFPPSELAALGLPSTMPGPHFTPHFSPIDVEAPDLARFPRYAQAKRYEFVLTPGDLLYFPAFHPHHVRALELSASVNTMCISLRTLFTPESKDYLRLCLAHALRKGQALRERWR